MLLGVGEGDGPFWFGLGLVITAVQLAFQIRVAVRGDEEPGWPLIGASTHAGRIASVAPAGMLSVFCLLGLLLGW